MGAIYMDEALILPGSTVLCAVSGGADSVCLLHMLSRRGDISLRAAHFNHRLRGEESDRDEQFVRELCREWNIPLTVGSGDVKAYAKAEKRSIEEAGRILRYNFLFETAEREGCHLIATAHNADDNLETLLLNLTRGSGLQGLTGVPPRQGMLIRPLLSTTRKEIETYLRTYGLSHVEDSSNRDETYSRNKMRRRVLPLLEELNPALRKNSADTIRYLRADNDYLNAQAAALTAQARTGPEGVSIDASLIAQAPDPIAIRAVRQLLSMTAQGSTDCTAAHLEGLAALCRSGGPSTLLDLPHGLIARREYDRLILTTRKEGPPLWAAFSPVEGDNPVPGTGWVVVVAGKPWPGLVVRPRRTGDAIPLPNGHTRSLKKLFIDRKIPRLSRDTIPIVADHEGVIAVAGLGSNTEHPRHGRIVIKVREDTKNECE